ncbi:MAG: hypothetical protein Q8O22_02180 [Candidatus Omnitrophota bacterium]|nr:hypothetical protein [Candidatus Omnitrophota bacterium]
MPRRIFYAVVIAGCCIFTCGAALAELQEKGESSEQDFKYTTNDDSIVEYTVPSKLSTDEEYLPADPMTVSQPLIEPDQAEPMPQDITYTEQPENDPDIK